MTTRTKGRIEFHYDPGHDIGLIGPLGGGQEATFVLHNQSREVGGYGISGRGNYLLNPGQHTAPITLHANELLVVATVHVGADESWNGFVEFTSTYPGG